jgi:hypothetical protein
VLIFLALHSHHPAHFFSVVNWNDCAQSASYYDYCFESSFLQNRAPRFL